jgi:hypothetical protein
MAYHGALRGQLNPLLRDKITANYGNYYARRVQDDELQSFNVRNFFLRSLNMPFCATPGVEKRFAAAPDASRRSGDLFLTV